MNAQQLKNSILQMAVQGKLVEQDPNDEPASVLIERIRAEKEQLIKDKKIKKEKNPSFIFRGADNLHYENIGGEVRCIADEVPFEIPDSWEWVRFVNLVDYSMGKTPPRKENIYWDNPNYSWVSIADLVADSVVQHTKEKVNEYASLNSFKERISPKGTLLMSFKLTVGKVSILGIDAYHNEAIISIYPYIDSEKIMTNFLFMSLPLLSLGGDTKSAIKGKTLNSDSINNLLIPVPPLNEQKKVVGKFNSFLPHIESYDTAHSKIEKLNTDFPEQLKKSILQWAVQGKLVPQDENDEPASVLLERIREEKAQFIKDKKIKKDKAESIIFKRDNSHYEKIGNTLRCIDDEIPFDIPDSWEWVRFVNLVDYSMGKTPPRKENIYWDNPSHSWVSIADLVADGIVKDTKEKVNEYSSIKLFREKISPKGTLLMSFKLTVGKVSILGIDAYHNEAIISIYPYIDNEKIMTNFLFMSLPLLSLGGDTKSAIKGKTLNSDSINNLLIPLPPLSEQQRIVNKIEELLKLNEKL